MMKVYRQTSRSVVFAALAAALLVPPAWRAHAIDGKEGDLHWSWDTTLTYGLFTRLEKRDPAIVGLGAGRPSVTVGHARLIAFRRPLGVVRPGKSRSRPWPSMQT